MPPLTAVRLALPADAGIAAGLWTAAARQGTLHASEEIVLCAFGEAATIELPRGLADEAAPDRVADALSSIALLGEDGPGGSGVVAFAALPFDATESASLLVPSMLCSWHPTSRTVWVTVVGSDDARDIDPSEVREALATRAAGAVAPGPLPPILSLAEQMSGTDYAEAVAQCVARLREGEVRKVVLARSVSGRCQHDIDTAALAAALHDVEPSCTLYAYPSGSRRFVGASPELLVATSDGAVSAHPLAGTVALTGGAGDDAQMVWLAQSAKNRVEHAVVVEDIVARLEPLCDDVSAPQAPVVVELTAVAHLGTWVDGKLRGGGSARSAVRALAALHPTPAVGGVPRDDALAIISGLESTRRGPWAGPVGWIDADGTSTWTLGLRGLLVEGSTIEAWAGAGIVADSDPDEELAETEIKLASVLRAFPS